MIRTSRNRIAHESHWVYEIPCLHCSITYIERTNRHTHNRMNKHRLRKLDPSSRKSRTIYKAMDIEEQPNWLNKRDGSLKLPTAYTSLTSGITAYGTWDCSPSGISTYQHTRSNINKSESTCSDQIYLRSRQIETLETSQSAVWGDWGPVIIL